MLYLSTSIDSDAVSVCLSASAAVRASLTLPSVLQSLSAWEAAVLYLSVCLSVCLSVWLSVCIDSRPRLTDAAVSAPISVCMGGSGAVSVYLSVCLCIGLCVSPSTAILTSPALPSAPRSLSAWEAAEQCLSVCLH